MYQVVKRDGKIVDFNINKIADAIKKAFDATKTEYNESVIDFLALKVSADFLPKIKDGKVAVEEAVGGETGKMVAFERKTVDGQYHCATKLIPLTAVANYEKKVPLEWITPEHNQVTDDLIDYVLPLIQGEPKLPLEHSMPRYARLKKIVAE